MIKAIIFDLLSVLTIENWSTCVIRELNNKFGLDKNLIKQEFKKHYQVFARDEISSEEFLEKFIGGLGLKPSGFEYLFNILPEFNNELFDFILKLKQKYKIYLFSNNCSAVFPNYLKKKNFSRYFDDIFVSYELKMNKTNEKVWDVILDNINCRPEEVIFIDDNEKYLEPAKKRGINTILFLNNEQIKNEINRHNH